MGKNVVHDIMLLMKNNLDLDSFLPWFDTKMKCPSIETSHSVENDVHNYTLKHDMEENWSLAIRLS
jgi:hypothetical protein